AQRPAPGDFRRSASPLRARDEVPRQRAGGSPRPQMHGLPGDAAAADLQRSAEWREGNGLRIVPENLLLQSRERSEAEAGSRDGYREKTRPPQGGCAAGMVLPSGLR